MQRQSMWCETVLFLEKRRIKGANMKDKKRLQEKIGVQREVEL